MQPFDRAVAVISLDTEQIWGYLNMLDEKAFTTLYPNTMAVHDALLDRLCAAGIRATWAVVGALALAGTDGLDDPLFDGIPRAWIGSVRPGTEDSAPAWYRRSFVRRLIAARPAQDVALHGGLSHLIWTDPDSTPGAIERELAGGIKVLEELGVRPRSFIFCRQAIAHLELLRDRGIHAYRGDAPVLSSRLKMKIPRAVLRIMEERNTWVPPVVWPEETIPGLWNIPASLSLYPIGRSRTRIVPLRTRLQRFQQGLDLAMRSRGVFHYWFHPDQLAEAPEGLALLDSILDRLVRAREAGDIEVLTMADIASRMESSLTLTRKAS